MLRKLFAKPGMSTRERILAALERKPVDRIPFVPLIDSYTLMDMPGAIQHEVQSNTGQDYWQGMLPAIRKIGVDIMLRHVYVVKPFSGSPHLSGLGQFKELVSTTSRMDGSILTETLSTPIGTLTGTWGFTDRHGWIPHPLKHMVSSLEELKIFDYALEHLSFEPPEPDFENFLNAETQIGDDGIATTSFLNTPLMHLIETCWGLENTHFMLYDYPSEVEGILDKLYRAQKRVVERIAESPAKVVIEYENTSSTLLSPRIFRQYCLPYLNEYADILHSTGKIFLVHMCGKLEAFAEDLDGARFDGIADISPQPTGDFGLDEAALRLGDKVLIGGIDANSFIEPDMLLLEQQIVALIERIKPYPGVLLGSADTAPRGTPLQNFQLIQHLVSIVGSYNRRTAASYRPGKFVPPAVGKGQTDPSSAGTNEVPEAPDMHLVLQELARRLDGKSPGTTGVIKFNVAGDQTYRLFIEAGKCRLEVSDGEADAAMTATGENLMALFSGKLKPMAAFMSRKIKFDGNLQLLGVLTAAAE
jgi:hypothetical protein